MTDTENLKINYLTFEHYKIIHKALTHISEVYGEPIPDFKFANTNLIKGLVNIPQTSFEGVELYPTLADKAAIIFFTINKRHIFQNGNKRMSALSLIVFLNINEKKLDVTEDEIRDKALELAKTTHNHDFDEIKKDLVDWINSRMIDLVIVN